MLPASAGMILSKYGIASRGCGAPRIRGDDPDKTLGFIIRNRCSPHPRG